MNSMLNEQQKIDKIRTEAQNNRWEMANRSPGNENNGNSIT